MRKLFAFLCFLSFCSMHSLAGDGEYAVSRINPAMLKNAHAVKRMEEMVFEIFENNKASYKHKVSFTILNELGERWAFFGEGYDKLRTIESFEGSLYDANGVKIKSLKKADIKDVTGNYEAGLADDNRVKWHNFFHKNFPYTVEYEIEIRYKGTMFIPDWTPVEKSLLSVEQSKLTIISPSDNPLRFKMFNYAGQPAISENKTEKIYSWEVKALPAIVSETAAPAWHEITTSVFLASEHFALDDYPGSNASWSAFGKFVYDLKKGKDELPAGIRQKVHDLADPISDVNEKIRKLYKYMQENTRFISIQLGIGGWQPFDASEVGNKRYGDCKALSNFMFALLKEAGIRSVYTVTRRGDDPNYLLTDFPSSQFNHVILFVPLGKDTTWLECTSQTYMPGYLGTDNSNRWAVAAEEAGGTLVRTPSYGLAENVQLRKINATLSPEGNLSLIAHTSYHAGHQDRLHHLINQLSKDKVKEYLEEKMDFATYEIREFDYKEERGETPAINETLDIAVSNYATVTGKRLFIVPNVMTRLSKKMSADSNRKYDIVFPMEYRTLDTVEINIPEGYSQETIPPDVSVSTTFGKYNSSIKLAGNKLIYTRLVERYAGRFPATDYAKLVAFTEAVYKADRSRVVLVKSELPKKGF